MRRPIAPTFFRCKREETSERFKRLDKERDQKRKTRGVWNSENNCCPGKGTETAEQEEIRRAKDRCRTAERYKNLSEEQKKNQSRVNQLRKKKKSSRYNCRIT
jgi:hypothetical protein